MIVFVLATMPSCRRSDSSDTISRLEASKEIEEEFGLAVVGLYPPEARVPELGTTISRNGHSFVLTATNESDLDIVAPMIARILTRNGIESASLVLVGSEDVIEGKKYSRENALFILGGYLIHDDGRVEELEADQIMEDSEDAMSRIPHQD